MLLDKANIIRQKRRSVKIKINSGGELTIFCPANLSYIKLEEIIQSKEKILNKKLNNLNKIHYEYADIINNKKIFLI